MVERFDERGSVLMLMPAAVMVFIVLGSLAVDAAFVFLAERDMANAAAAAANDAAGEALDLDHFYATGEIRLLPGRAATVAAESVAGKSLDHLRGVRSLTVVEAGGTDVSVTVYAEAPSIFARAIPGGSDAVDVSASARATAERQ